MIGLQRSSGLSTMHDRKTRNNNHQSLSSSSSSSSLPPSNIHLINTFKQPENKRFNQQWSQDTTSNNIILQQQMYPRQQISISSRMSYLILI
jgi:hypothetical protein